LATVRAHIHEAPPPLSAHHADAGPEIEAIISKALAKDPARRFRSGAAMAAAFEDAILAADPPTPRPGTIPPLNAAYRPAEATGIGASYTPLPHNVDPANVDPVAEAPPRYDPRDAFGAVIPGPPVGRVAGPSADTDRWQAGAPLPDAAVRRRRSSSVVGIIALLLVAFLVAAGAYLVRSTDLLTAFGGPPATAARAGCRHPRINGIAGCSRHGHAVASSRIDALPHAGPDAAADRTAHRGDSDPRFASRPAVCPVRVPDGRRKGAGSSADRWPAHGDARARRTPLDADSSGGGAGQLVAVQGRTHRRARWHLAHRRC
jgi:serine/threonine-protein kinase